MFDNFHFEDYIEDIPEIQNDNLISVFPNPADEFLFIQKANSSDQQIVQLFDYAGQTIYDNQNYNGKSIDTRKLINGIYLLKYSDTKSFSVKQFVVQH